MKSIANTAWQIEWIYCKDFPGRPFPLVILQDGKPGFIINKWIYWLIEEGTPPSSLEQHIRAIMQLYEFCFRHYANAPLNENQSHNLISDFINARKNGSVLMGWKPNPRTSTLQKYLRSINLFDKWNSTFNNHTKMNPSEEVFLNGYKASLLFRTKTKFDLLLHLHPSRSHKAIIYTHNIHIDHKRFLINQHSVPKAFPIERFVDLVENTPNPRDQMLWLLMGGGSLRQSETLHLYYEDILGVTEHGLPRIRLADPETGTITWYKDGQQNSGSRRQYLEECYMNEKYINTRPELYNILPRTLGIRGKNHVGFKGMTFSDNGENEIIDGRYTNWNELFWIEPAMGYRFQKAYNEYVTSHFYDTPRGWPWHPWLFIATTKERYGTPLSLGAVRQAWKAALKRVRLEDSHLSPHSLRHMYGAYCASILQLPLELTRTLMHHASINSTQAYYHLRSSDVRNAITEAILNRQQTEEFQFLIMPSAPRLNVPDNWNSL